MAGARVRVGRKGGGEAGRGLSRSCRALWAIGRAWVSTLGEVGALVLSREGKRLLCGDLTPGTDAQGATEEVLPGWYVTGQDQVGVVNRRQILGFIF